MRRLSPGKINPVLIAFLIPLVVIIAAAMLLILRNHFHHSLEAFNVAAYQHSPGDLAGNQYNLDAQIDGQLKWDEGFGRLMSVKPLDGSGRLSVFIPESVGSDLKVGQRFHMTIMVKDKGLIQVEALDKY